jgi:uncharacterized membrane protein YGL010W
LVLWVISSLWYLSRGALLVGMATAVANGALMWLAQAVSGGSTLAWLSWGLGAFAVGWVFQFIGHHYEGKKPAFVDDLVGLLVGPMFVVAELLFALGLLRPLAQQVETEAGPTR